MSGGNAIDTTEAGRKVRNRSLSGGTGIGEWDRGPRQQNRNAIEEIFQQLDRDMHTGDGQK